MFRDLKRTNIKIILKNKYFTNLKNRWKKERKFLTEINKYIYTKIFKDLKE